MTDEAVAATQTPKKRRVLHYLAALLAGALVASLAVAAYRVATPSREERLAELRAYLDDLKPLAEELGFLVIHGLRAGVNDIAQGEVEQTTLVRQARGWRRDLVGLKQRFDDLETPRGLDDANNAFIESIDGYIQVTRRLEAAAQAPRYRQRMLVRRAADYGQRMDRVWNRGAYAFQRELAALGEDMVIWLPDPTVNPDSDDYVDGDPDERRPNDFLRGPRPTASS